VREHLRITFGGRPSFEVTRIEHLTEVLDGEEGWERPDWPAAQPVLEQRPRRPLPGIALASGNVIAGALAGRGSGAARRRPAGQASRPAFVSRRVIDTRASVRRTAPPSIQAATWSRRWPSGPVPNWVVYPQLRADPTADRRPDLPG